MNPTLHFEDFRAKLIEALDCRGHRPGTSQATRETIDQSGYERVWQRAFSEDKSYRAPRTADYF